MDVEITIGHKSAIVIDNEIRYDIFFEEVYYLDHKRNCIYIPFIKDVTRDTILACHEEIKRQLVQLNDIIDNLPRLELCRLPIPEDFNSNGEILLSDGDYIENYNFIILHQMKENCRISIYCGNNGNIIFIKNISRNESYYRIENKITIINQPFDAELFAESIRTYASNYLSVLFSIFRNDNIKSARLN